VTTANERQTFAPPPTTGTPVALLLAVLAHGLLALILSIGVQWRREPPVVTAQAELWARLPVEAAPPTVPVEPPPPEPRTAEPPKPPQPTAADLKDKADIAIAREKAQRQQREQEAQEKQRLLAQEKAKAEKEAKEKATKDKLAREQAERDKAAKDKLADAAKQKEKDKAAALRREQEEAKKLEEQRQQNLKRMAGLAGTASGNGDSNSTGTAARSAGPSAGYSDSIGALIRQRIVFTDDQKRAIAGNPAAQVDIRVAPGGILLDPQIIKSSGSPEWDAAVVKAIRATGSVPRDSNGNFPTLLQFSFRPKDI
jgi:colicin import membrane protein